MINATAGIGDGRLDVVRFHIRHLIQNFDGSKAVGDADANATDAWASAALGGVHGDAFEQSFNKTSVVPTESDIKPTKGDRWSGIL